MIRARVIHGLLEIQDPIPEEWEGQSVKLVPLTPDDEQPDLEECLAEQAALGPMEYEDGEREAIASALAEQKRLSRIAMQNLADRQQ